MRNLVWALLLAVLPGCFTYHYRNNSVNPGEEHPRWASYFLYGLIGNYEVDAREMCGTTEVAEVTTGTNFLTWLVSTVTIGIYTPRKVNITCGATRSAAFEVEIGRDGAPHKVTRREGGKTWAGIVKPGESTRYSVKLEEVK